MSTNPEPAAAPHEPVVAALKGVFGFDAFREGQEAVVTRLVEGRSVLAVFPTGGGKSLCYQLPALVLDGLTLVISPLIALMKDQLDFLSARGAPAGRLDSSLTREENLALYDALHAGRLKLLYVSPERLGNERFLQTLRNRSISLLAIDEAHCISEWGHNFRPDYLKIAQLARELRVERVLALTATATPKVAQDITRAFSIDAGDVVHTGFYRPNLALRVTPCTAAQRNALLLERLCARPAGPTIVYVTLQRTAELVAAYLAARGLNARAYHAGMETEQRTEVQEAFMASTDAIIVATIAFGMGVDKSDIRYVYHYNLPKGLESYSQEIGRAGRDGKPSVCEMLACMDDVVTLENFVYGDTPTSEAVAALVGEVLSQGEVFDVSVDELGNRHDIRPLVVKTLLTYLELKNVIASTGPFYSSYKFQPQRSSAEILAKFDPDRARFLRQVFQHARKGKTWFSLDVEATSRLLHESRQRIVAALGYLEEAGDLVLQAAGVRQGYRLIELPSSVDELCKMLDRRFQQRETTDVARIQQVVDFAREPGCLTQRLLTYLGEQRADCGHCSRCEGEPPQPLPGATQPTLGTAQIGQINQLLQERHAALQSPRQVARFLCGLVSPATTRAKLKQHPLFGAFDSLPFGGVLQLVEAQWKTR